jgi:hypothetical protein
VLLNAPPDHRINPLVGSIRFPHLVSRNFFPQLGSLLGGVRYSRLSRGGFHDPYTRHVDIRRIPRFCEEQNTEQSLS